jgi:FAD/FMN-containing dehydrogenase
MKKWLLNDESLNSLHAALTTQEFMEKSEAEAYLFDDYTGLQGSAIMVIRPSNVNQICRIVEICNHSGIGVVARGGGTGRVAGAIPASERPCILISFESLNKMINVDPLNLSVTVEAGVTLETLQSHLKDLGLRLTVDLGARKFCQIGGMLATNAGGIRALRYGSMRDNVLGLEVVCPNGRLWTNLKALRKDNTGYDLKQLFVGSEGTLGLITKAMLKVEPVPKSAAACIIGLNSIEFLPNLLLDAKRELGDFLSSFELFSKLGVDHAISTDPSLHYPLRTDFTDFILVELETCTRANLTEILREWTRESRFGLSPENVVVAEDSAQREAFWRIRELTPWAGGQGINFDISVPIATIPLFLSEAAAAVALIDSNALINAFGHVGDGNIHYHIVPGPNAPAICDLLSKRSTLRRAIHDIAHDLGGSYCAEHGIGRTQKSELLRFESGANLAMMQRCKSMLDPNGIMNPGVFFE